MAKQKEKNSKQIPHRPEDVPVTQKMLYGVRDELKTDIQSVRVELKGEIQSVRAELKGEIHDLKTETQVSATNVTSQIHRLGVLIEEQNARNVIVLDSIAGFIARQDRFDEELTHVRKVISGIK